MIIHIYLSKIKNKNDPPTFLQGSYGENLGEFSNTSYGVFEAERLRKTLTSFVVMTTITHHCENNGLRANWHVSFKLALKVVSLSVDLNKTSYVFNGRIYSTPQVVGHEASH